MQYLCNSLTDFDEICYNEACWPSQPDLLLKIWNFENLQIQYGRRPPSWKWKNCNISITVWLIISAEWTEWAGEILCDALFCPSVRPSVPTQYLDACLSVCPIGRAPRSEPQRWGHLRCLCMYVKRLAYTMVVSPLSVCAWPPGSPDRPSMPVGCPWASRQQAGPHTATALAVAALHSLTTSVSNGGADSDKRL